jgi:phage-related protein
MGRQPVYQGIRHEIRCLDLADGTCPAGDFLVSLGPVHRARIHPLLQMLGDHGRSKNEEHFRKLDEVSGIHHIRNQDVHLLGFFNEGSLILLHGWLSKSRTAGKEDVEKAKEHRERFLSSQG